VNTQINDGVVTLSGWVTMPYKSNDLERRVGRVDGVTKVVNNLKELPVSQFDDELRIASPARSTAAPLPRLRFDGEPADSHHRGARAGDAEGVVNNNVDRMIARSIASSFPSFDLKNDLKTTRKRGQPRSYEAGGRLQARSPKSSRPRGTARRPFLIQPDRHRKRHRGGDVGGAEQKQRRIQDRPRLHVHLKRQRLPATAPTAAGPTQDVAALCAVGVVMKSRSARGPGTRRPRCVPAYARDRLSRGAPTVCSNSTTSPRGSNR
jgi:hypothetical protein